VVIKYAFDATAPLFLNSSTFSIAENTPISTNVATISVNESSTITITSGTDSARFTLVTSDSVTARVRFLSSPDFEAPADVGANNVYDISVRATDTAGNIANQSISITVTNVNEAPEISLPSANPTHAITQAENISSITTYTATDVDAGTTLTWSISGTDAAAFTINSSSGVLTFAANPDFEAPQDADTNNSYILIVTVSDGSLSDTQTLTITITNANESSSVGAPAISGTISKRIATTISVTVNTAGKVRFFVGGKRITKCLARTTTGSYPTLTATCSWRPAVTGRQVITARLTPTDNTFSASTSVRSEVFVLRRTTTR
jgi:serralysin